MENLMDSGKKEEPKKPKRYLVTYQLKKHEGGILAQDIPAGHGASDALVVISQLYLGDGQYSQLTSSLDGRTGEDVEPGELWKAWMLLAQGLATEDNGLDARRKMVAWTAFALASKMIYGTTPDPPPEIAEQLAKIEGLVGYRKADPVTDNSRVPNDVLYEFALAMEKPNAGTLDDFVRRYPQHADALKDFAVELALDPPGGEEEIAKPDDNSRSVLIEDTEGELPPA